MGIGDSVTRTVTVMADVARASTTAAALRGADHLLSGPAFLATEVATVRGASTSRAGRRDAAWPSRTREGRRGRLHQGALKRWRLILIKRGDDGRWEPGAECLRGVGADEVDDLSESGPVNGIQSETALQEAGQFPGAAGQLGRLVVPSSTPAPDPSRSTCWMRGPRRR